MTRKKATKAAKTSKSGSKRATPRGAAARVGAGAPISGDWRAERLARIRVIMREADPELVEEVKWRKPSNSMAGVAVWSHPRAGMICTGEMYKGVVKMTFAKGASLEDPTGLFNASLEGRTRRAIDLREGDAIDAGALKALVRAAVGLDRLKSADGGAGKPPGRSKAGRTRK